MPFFAEVVPADIGTKDDDNYFMKLDLVYTDDKTKKKFEPEETRDTSGDPAKKNAAKTSNRRAREKKLKQVLQSSSAQKADLTCVEAIRICCLRKSGESKTTCEVTFRSWEGIIRKDELETSHSQLHSSQQSNEEQDEIDRKKSDDILRQILFAFLQNSTFSIGDQGKGGTYSVSIPLPSDESSLPVTITKTSDSDSNVTYTLHQFELTQQHQEDGLSPLILSLFQGMDHMDSCARHYQELSERVQKQFAEVSQLADDATRSKEDFYTSVLSKFTAILNEKKKEISRLRECIDKAGSRDNEGIEDSNESEQKTNAGDSEQETDISEQPKGAKRARSNNSKDGTTGKKKIRKS